MIIFMCAYTHKDSIGHTDSESAQHFDSVTDSHRIFLVLLTGFKPRVIESWVRCSTNWATPSPHLYLTVQQPTKIHFSKRKWTMSIVNLSHRTTDLNNKRFGSECSAITQLTDQLLVNSSLDCQIIMKQTAPPLDSIDSVTYTHTHT